MKQRNPFVVFLLTFITFGIYGIVWSVKTKNEMNKLGASIPTAWLLIIPFVSIYWTYKYCEGVDHVTNGKQSTVIAFILLFLLGPIGMAIIQLDFNKLGDSPATPSIGGPVAAAPFTPPAGITPDNSFGGPAPVAPQTVAPATPAPAPAPASNPAPISPQPVAAAAPAPVQPQQPEAPAPVVVSGVITPTQLATPAAAPASPATPQTPNQPPTNPVA